MTRIGMGLVGAGFVAFETVSPVTGKTNFAKIYRHRARRRPAVNDERLAQSLPGVNPVDEPLVVDVFRRHRTLRGFALVRVGVIRVVAHDAEFRVVPLLAVGLELQMTGVAVIRLDGDPARHGYFVGDR